MSGITGADYLRSSVGGGALNIKVKRVQYLLNYLLDRPNYELICHVIIAALSVYAFMEKNLPRISMEYLSKMIAQHLN